MIKVVRNRRTKPQQTSKLVMKAAEHAQRKQQMQHTYKPDRLNERTLNKILGVAIVVTFLTFLALFGVLLA